MEPEKVEELSKIREALVENKIRIWKDTEIIFDKLLGEGSFGTVWKGKISENESEIVAVKLLDKIDTDTSKLEETIKTLVNELKAMTKISHDQIPKFYGIVEKIKEDQIHFGLIFSFIDGVTLQRYMLENGKQMKESEKCEFIISLLNVIIDLHKNGVIHRDIKPENIMITPEKKVILLDFGISKISEKTVTYTIGKKMTPKYSPPEAFLDSGADEEVENFVISKKFDVWSLGCVIAEMFSGVVPWSNKIKDEARILLALSKKVKFEVEGVKYDFPFAKTMPKETPEILEICNKCIQTDLNKRITSDELLKLMQERKECYLKEDK